MRCPQRPQTSRPANTLGPCRGAESSLPNVLFSASLCWFSSNSSHVETQQQAVVVLARIVQAVGVGQQRAIDGAQLQQCMPVFARPRQPAHLQAEDQPDAIGTDFRQQPLKAAAPLRRTAALSLVFVNHLDRRTRPAQGRRAIDQGILPRRRLAMLQHLLLRRLPHVDDRQPRQMLVADLLGAKRGPPPILAGRRPGVWRRDGRR